MKRFLSTLLISAACTSTLLAQSTTDPYAHHWTLLAGLGQPLFGHGVNVAGTYFTRRITFEYSHGMFLRYTGALLSDKNIESIYAHYSTGLGVGYRLTRYLDIRAEAKNHRFTAQLNHNQSVTYTNTDLGAGVYYRLYPFARQASWRRGLVVEPSVRYWHYIYSTLPDGAVIYTTDAGQLAQHHPYNFGLFANVSIGYTFGLRGKR